MNRREEREQAFILVFEKLFRDEAMEEIFECAAEARDYIESEYVRNVCIGIYSDLSKIDTLIADNLKGWALGRISKVGLAAMRIAIYEMLYIPEIPVSVSINEAIELIKKYATEKDAAFANGLLGTVAKGIDKQ